MARPVLERYQLRSQSRPGLLGDPPLLPSRSAHLVRCGVGMTLRQALDACGVKLVDPEKVNRVREALPGPKEPRS